MAEKQCNLIKNGGIKYRVVATANANQTWAQQLTQLESAFNGLRTDEKIHSRLIQNSVGNEAIFLCTNIGVGVYERVSMSTQVIAVNISTHKANYWHPGQGSSTSDISNETQTVSLSLITDI